MPVERAMPILRARPAAEGALRGARLHGRTPVFGMWVRVLPIVFFLSYLTLTVLLFAFGPWKYPVSNPLQLYLFLALAHLSLLAGYLSGAFGRPQGYRGRWSVRRLVLWSGVVTLALLFPTSQFRTGHFIPNVASGLANPARAYEASQLLRQTGQPTIEYVRIILGPVLILLLPLTVFYWSRLALKLKALAVAGILGTAAIFIAMGTNNVVVDTAVLVPLLLVSSHLAGVCKLNWKRVVAVATAAGCALALFLVYFFGVGVSSRKGSPLAGDIFPAASTSADYRAIERGETTFLSLDLYLTQGYYALSLSLRVPFVPMYGVGNSMFLTRQVARLTGDSGLVDMTYPARIERYGWSAEGLWSSIYPWIAFDVSFPGTLIVVLLIGRLFALSWLDALSGTNPFAVVLLSQLMIMLFYFPANNQLLQSGEGFTAFWVTLLIWLGTRRRLSKNPAGSRPRYVGWPRPLREEAGVSA